MVADTFSLWLENPFGSELLDRSGRLRMIDRDCERERAMANIESKVPFEQRLSCTISEACQATGLGRTKLYSLMEAGVLRTVTVGRRRLILMDSLRAILKPPQSTH